MNETRTCGQEAGSTLLGLSRGLPGALPARIHLAETVSRRFGPIRPEISDLRRICEPVVASLAKLARAKNVTLEVAHFANEVRADPDVLSRALFDLLHHQIDGASAGSTLTLLTTPRRTSVEIRVIDWSARGHSVPPRSLSMESAPTLAGALAALREHGGACSVEAWARARALCVRLPRVH
jgi:signal transduction histidine kinase